MPLSFTDEEIAALVDVVKPLPPALRGQDKDEKGRGYEISKGRYVEIDEDELEAVKLESTHTIEIDSFVPRSEIDNRYLDRPYYVAPSEKVGAEAFAVMRDAMKNKDRVALARVVLGHRETRHLKDE
jgi:Ku protein